MTRADNARARINARFILQFDTANVRVTCICIRARGGIFFFTQPATERRPTRRYFETSVFRLCMYLFARRVAVLNAEFESRIRASSSHLRDSHAERAFSFFFSRESKRLFIRNSRGSNKHW